MAPGSGEADRPPTSAPPSPEHADGDDQDRDLAGLSAEEGGLFHEARDRGMPRLVDDASRGLVRPVEAVLRDDEGEREEGQEAEDPALEHRSIRTHSDRLWHGCDRDRLA